MEPSTTTSLTRSTTESMNAPRGPAWPAAARDRAVEDVEDRADDEHDPRDDPPLLEDQDGGRDVQEEAGGSDLVGGDGEPRRTGDDPGDRAARAARVPVLQPIDVGVHGSEPTRARGATARRPTNGRFSPTSGRAARTVPGPSRPQEPAMPSSDPVTVATSTTSPCRARACSSPSARRSESHRSVSTSSAGPRIPTAIPSTTRGRPGRRRSTSASPARRPCARTARSTTCARASSRASRRACTRQIVTTDEPVEVLCLGGVPGGVYPAS